MCILKTFVKTLYTYFYYLFIYLFIYYFSSTVVSIFTPAPAPTPLILASHPWTYPLCLCPHVFFTCSVMVLPLFPPIISLPTPLCLLSISSLFQCLWLSFACWLGSTYMLVRMHTGAGTMKNSMEFSQKNKNGTVFWPSMFLKYDWVIDILYCNF